MKRNLFSLSHFKLLTGKMGYLYPISCVDVLPGDTFQMSSSVFLRFSPLVAPVMTPVTVKIHHYFVPLRLIWEDSEDFLTGGKDGMFTAIPPSRKLPSTYDGYQGSLLDYFGVPNPPESIANDFSVDVSMLPLRAYFLIWNEWYRDQNLQDEIPIPLYSGLDNGMDDRIPTNLARVAWDKDYFTTATPWEQKGLAVSVPISGLSSSAFNVTGAPAFSNIEIPGHNRMQLYATPEGTVSYLQSSNGEEENWQNVGLSKGSLGVSYDSSQATGGINLNDFREAMSIQRFEEARALYGSRYIEYLRYLGVKGSDARLQRPEYLGGGRSVIQFSEVLQTAEGTDPVGTMRGHGIGAMRTNRFRRFFEEHGIVMSLMSITPRSIYTQGLPRQFRKKTKFDYWQRELQHIGQQEIKNSEVFLWQEDYDEAFGYQDRYDEYRSQPSTVHGEFRNLLNYWHLGREFDQPPVLNSSFISANPSDRIFADQTGNDTIYMMVNNSIQARRLVAKRGNPR